MAEKRASAGAKGKSSSKEETSPLLYEVLGIILIALAIITIFEYGLVGKFIYSISLFFFGNLHIVVPFLLVLAAVIMMITRKAISFKNRLILGVLIIVTSMTIFSHGIFFEELLNAKALKSNSVFYETWRVLFQNGGIENRSTSLGGGMIGALFFSGFHLLLDSSGTKIAAWVMFIIGMILVTGKALVPFIAENLPLWKKNIRNA